LSRGLTAPNAKATTSNQKHKENFYPNANSIDLTEDTTLDDYSEQLIDNSMQQ